MEKERTVIFISVFYVVKAHMVENNLTMTLINCRFLHKINLTSGFFSFKIIYLDLELHQLLTTLQEI